MSHPPTPVYPIPRSDSSSRIPLAVLFDVADALRSQGYPPIATDPDVLRLEQALEQFLFGTQQAGVAR